MSRDLRELARAIELIRELPRVGKCQVPYYTPTFYRFFPDVQGLVSCPDWAYKLTEWTDYSEDPTGVKMYRLDLSEAGQLALDCYDAANQITPESEANNGE